MLYESGAIVEYLIAQDSNGALKPPVDSPLFPRYPQWFHYCEGADFMRGPRLLHGAPARLHARRYGPPARLRQAPGSAPRIPSGHSDLNHLWT